MRSTQVAIGRRSYQSWVHDSGIAIRFETNVWNDKDRHRPETASGRIASKANDANLLLLPPFTTSQPKLSVDDIIERRKKSRPEVRLPSPEEDEGDADDESAVNDLSKGEDADELEFHGFNEDEDEEMDSGDDQGEWNLNCFLELSYCFPCLLLRLSLLTALHLSILIIRCLRSRSS